MTTRRSARFVLASISAVALLAPAASALAQGYDQGPPPGYDQNQGPPPGYDQNQPPPQQGDYAPPRGQYAPPPPGANNGGAYDDNTQQYDRDYAQRYSGWAAQNCVDRRNNNTAAGAIIGGVLGAVIGGNVAGRGDQFGGAVVGGALGATAGAAIGSSSTNTTGCPPGYYVRSGAPGFYYDGPYSAPAAVYAPGWYNPWAFVGGQYVYRPYRYWYWNHPTYWRPGFRARPFRYRYRRW
ncbi:MAG TPA: hypothetical protein VIB82_10560 [Caulobacteraceae bacterium]|jgi:hypothetical protein